MRNLEREIPGYKGGNRLVQEGIERVSGIIAHPRLQGKENLTAVRELIKGRARVFLMGNHLSHLDGPTLYRSLRDAGYSDIADRIVLLMGTRITRNPLTHFLSSSYARIYVPQVHDEVKDSNGGARKAREMLRNAAKAVPAVFDKGGVVGIFPEGTRSRSSELSTGLPQVAHYIKKEDFILPFGLWGTEKALPVGGSPKPNAVYINFGKPFSVSEIEGLQGADKTTRNKRLIDAVMERIAPLLPEKYRGIYAEMSSNR